MEDQMNPESDLSLLRHMAIWDFKHLRHRTSIWYKWKYLLQRRQVKTCGSQDVYTIVCNSEDENHLIIECYR
jgi:hypothetical protein